MTIDRRTTLSGLAAGAMALVLPAAARAQAGGTLDAGQAARQPARRRDAGAALVFQGPEDRRMVVRRRRLDGQGHGRRRWA